MLTLSKDNIEFQACCSSIILYSTFREITLFAKTTKPQKNQNSRFEKIIASRDQNENDHNELYAEVQDLKEKLKEFKIMKLDNLKHREIIENKKKKENILPAKKE